MNIKIPNITKQIHEEDILRIIENEYSTLGPLWVTQQMEWFNGIYSSFKNHDKFLIIIYLLKKTMDFYSLTFTKLTYDEFYKKNTVEISRFNVSEVSIALNIPKESTRRKIIELEDLGVIKRYKKKIIIDRSSYKYIKPTNTIKRISRFLSAVSKMCVSEKILDKTITSEKLESVIKDNFSYIWKAYYELQIPMVLGYKKIFNDLETFHIFGTCVVNQHLHAQNLNKLKMDRIDFIDTILSLKARGLNAMSISDITKIPRATVIRKLQHLVRLQQLTIDEKKLYKLSGNFLERIKKPQKVVLKSLANFSSKIFNFVDL